ncbi:MAG: HAMP domain-containing sensor histidine kinase [Anaerosomatales bacterium]|nr:HAMP domain-containing sensor histidine kinase [Anaerosomatales bacterium]
MSGRRRLSAVSRVAIGTTVAIAAGVVAVSTVSYAIVARSLSTQLDARLVQETSWFAEAVAQGKPASREALREAVRAYFASHSSPSAEQAPILVVRLADGTVISNSEVRLESVVATASQPPGPSIKTAAFEGRRYRVASSPITGRDGIVLGTFWAALSLRETEAVRTDLATTLALVSVAVTILGAAASATIARAALAPLRRVAAAVEAIEDASERREIPYDGPRDEVGLLVEAIDRLLERVETALAEQKRFVADASHELRTPLAIARGHLDLLRRACDDGPSAEESLDVVRDELLRMERIIADLLDLAALDAGASVRPFQELDVSVLLTEIAHRARSMGATDVRVSAAPSLWISGDPDLLERALVNFVKNALAAAGSDAPLEVSAVADDGTVTIAVADRGPGVPEEDLGRIFDRFYRGARTSSGRSGSGLGLAIAAQVAALHRGTVAAANRPDGGAVFSMTLPRVRNAGP